MGILPSIETIDAMAEPIGIASGLLALAGFAFQASIALCQTVQSFKFHPKQLRDLKDELEALSGVLSSLTETVSATTDVDLSALDLPLLRCGRTATHQRGTNERSEVSSDLCPAVRPH